jgi:hypothetical protein
MLGGGVAAGAPNGTTATVFSVVVGAGVGGNDVGVAGIVVGVGGIIVGVTGFGVAVARTGVGVAVGGTAAIATWEDERPGEQPTRTTASDKNTKKRRVERDDMMKNFLVR